VRGASIQGHARRIPILVVYAGVAVDEDRGQLGAAVRGRLAHDGIVCHAGAADRERLSGALIAHRMIDGALPELTIRAPGGIGPPGKLLFESAL
jgi:hypothetical protein